MDPSAIELSAGHLGDDVQTIHEYLESSEPTPAPWHELSHLVGILRAVEAKALP